MICNSPSGIYHYALPFSPSKSWLRECYSTELLQEVKVVKGLQAEWGTCSRTVSFDDAPRALACWGNLVAVGFRSGNIITLDAITGICISALSRHILDVYSLTFSSGGTFLVSGSRDSTVKLLDVQTGGVVKTFHGHTDWVLSVSISLDHAIIASGSVDRTIRLWKTQSGECHCVIGGHNGNVMSVNFSPTNSQLLISASYDHTVKQWDINGCQIGSTYEGDGVAFSLDGTYFVSWRWRGTVATVWNSSSGLVVAELQVPNRWFQCCCFSRNGKFVAGSSGCTIYVWDITSFNSPPIVAFVGHTVDITSLTFSSSLISSSDDKSIKFWQIGASLADPVTINPDSTPSTSAPITLVNLQAKDGIAISGDKAGVVKTWDISTGLCKASFHPPVQGFTPKDIQLVNSGLLIFVWCTDKEIYIWDTGKGELLQMVNTPFNPLRTSLRISGDGSQVFLVDPEYIRVLSIQTGEVIDEVRLEGNLSEDPLIVDGLRVWVCFEDSQTQGWDFGVGALVPIPLSNTPPHLDRPCLDFVGGTDIWSTGPSRIMDMATGKEVFQLPGRYAKPTAVQLDDRYLVAGYESGEVLILDFICMTPQ